jgi:hypothetical protein
VIQATPTLTGQGGLAGVSCLSAADCTAFGTQTGQQAGHRPLIEHWDGTSWAIQPSPSPVGSPEADLVGGSCTSSASCTAIGGYDNAAGTAVPPFAIRWNGTTWTIQALNAPDEGSLAAVSCSSASSCTAVGGPSNTGLAEHWDGINWAVQPTPVPMHGTTTFAILLGVSCLPATYCTAVGYYNRAQPLADHE